MPNCVFIICSKIHSKILNDKNIIAIFGVIGQNFGPVYIEFRKYHILSIILNALSKSKYILACVTTCFREQSTFFFFIKQEVSFRKISVDGRVNPGKHGQRYKYGQKATNVPQQVTVNRPFLLETVHLALLLCVFHLIMSLSKDVIFICHFGPHNPSFRFCENIREREILKQRFHRMVFGIYFLLLCLKSISN